MRKYHDQFPQYGFADHKGYLTESHFLALKQHGPCPLHRRKYEPVRILLEPATAEQLDFAMVSAVCAVDGE
jgi:ribonuclease HII